MPNYVRYFPNVWLGQMNLHLYLEILDFRYDELNVRGQIPEDTAMVPSIQGRRKGLQLFNRRFLALNQPQYLRSHQTRSPLFIPKTRSLHRRANRRLIFFTFHLRN